MKTLAIRGNKARGNEIIEMLEMLGGENVFACKATSNELIYFIDTQFIKSYPCETDEDDNFIIFTLEQFTEKFPYKVGDIVTTLEEERKGVIKTMRWQMSLDSVAYTIQWSDGNRGDYLESMLKPYTAPEPPQPAIDHANSNHALVKEALIARFMQMPKEDLAAALADITVSNALFKSAMNSLNTQDLCTLDAKVYINGQKIDTTFLDNTQTANNQ